MALAALALFVPASASASHAQVSCTMESHPTGQSLVGVVYGYVVGAPGEAVTVTCIVKVDGVQVGSTPLGSGSTAAFSAGDVAYTAQPTSVVTVCARYTSAHTSDDVCTPAPPPVVSVVPACGSVDWVDGDSCHFTAPLGTTAFSGQAVVTSGTATVTVEIVLGGVVLGSCTDTAPLAAECSAVAPTPVTTDFLRCVVRGSGGPSFQCGDPPALPGQR